MTSKVRKNIAASWRVAAWRVGPFVAATLVVLPRLLGCSSSSNEAVTGGDGGGPFTGGDAGGPDTDATVVAPGDDAMTLVGDDANQPAYTGSPVVSADGGLTAAIGPLSIAISATGHSRFYNVKFDPAGNIYAVGVVADGTDASTDFAMVVAKFSPVGVIDTTFGTNGFAIKNVAVGTNGEFARGLTLQSTGKIVISGTIEHAGAADPRDRDLAAVRFDANGALDTTFGTAGVSIIDLSTGQVGTGTTYLADGHWSLNADSQDRLVITGSQKDPAAAYTDFAVLRLTPSGALDTTFGTNGVFTMNVDGINAGARNGTILDGGSIIAAGYTETSAGSIPVIYKLTPDGHIDTTFADAGVFHRSVLGASTETYAAVPQGDKLVTTGYGRDTADASLDFVSLRLTAAGALDTTYGVQGATKIDIGGFGDNSRNLLALPDNRVLLVGGGRPVSDNVDGVVAVLTENGQPDTTFADAGFRLFDLGGPADFFWGVALSPAKDRVAVVGIDGVGSQPGHDTASLLILPVPH
jgi:uncharacterized delta-60 repeat protein